MSLYKIISAHEQISVQKKKCSPSRLVEVWTYSTYFHTPEGRITSLVITAFDLYSSLFGDCAYSIFSGLKGMRSLNFFQIPSDQYTNLTRGIKQYLTVKKCSSRTAFRDVTAKGLKLLSEIAYKITVSRVWAVKHRSLDPVYNPASEIKNEALAYYQNLSPYLIKDVIGIILMYSVDPCVPNHLRCSKENQDGTRCNELSVSALDSCVKHQNNPYYLSNHYLKRRARGRLIT